MTRRGQSVLLCQTRKSRRTPALRPEQDIYECPGRGKDCRFAENADGSLQRFGADASSANGPVHGAAGAGTGGRCSIRDGRVRGRLATVSNSWPAELARCILSAGVLYAILVSMTKKKKRKGIKRRVRRVRRDATTGRWMLHEAKAHFSEVVQKTRLPVRSALLCTAAKKSSSCRQRNTPA